MARSSPAGGIALADDTGEITQREIPAAILDRDLVALAAQQHLEELLNRITTGIFEVGIVLSTVPGMSPGGLNKRIDEAVRLLDDIVSGIYDTAFRGYGDVCGAARMPAGLHSPANAGLCEREGT